MSEKQINSGNYLWEDPPDADKWLDCVHCGMCLESCPTYEQTGQEQHSPRGRVHLIESVAKGRLEVDEQFMEPVFACLNCRACTTACPADVDVGGLIEEARGQIWQAMPPSGWKAMLSRLFLQVLFPHPGRMHLMAAAIRFYRKSGLQRVVRTLRLTKLLPRHLAEMEAVMREAPPPVRKKYEGTDVIPARGPLKNKVAVLTGCIMDVMFGDVNQSTVDVLTRNGNEVTIPGKQTCCGALSVHAGDRKTGRKLAKQNIEAFAGAEHVIVNSAGCGSMLKEYPELFREDPEWRERAEVFSRKAVDISKYLHDTGFETPGAALKTRVAYHDACHLAHGQGVRMEPRVLLGRIPGVELVHMPNADRCCGSAGIYNITRPQMAGAVLESKMANVPGDVDAISMGNPGCMLQMAVGVRKYGGRQQIVHTVQLLDQAYKREEEGEKHEA